ncbi:MAG: N-acetyl-gamma-glutamyl-phosphate reductase [Clostridiales bacterium]|nr:N-acetyl-gamma-glutamyl-phosphate reductase [Clostridiales bacterium]
MKPKIYIDGKEGTTGLKIFSRLEGRDDIELLLIDKALRKDTAERKRLMNEADIVFFCLPDAAAIEAAALVENPNTRIIDASTAHRTDPAWDYGFPELSSEFRERIITSRRVANPGCHASGFISIVYPLVKSGVLPSDYPLTCYSLTGYSGGGKKLIAEYEDVNRDPRHESHRIYGLNLTHKHLPEMKAVCGLTRTPLFMPVLGDFHAGMATTIMLHNSLLPGKPKAQDIHKLLREHYSGQHFVSVAEFGGDEPVIYASTLTGTNKMKLTVCGTDELTSITSEFDNLGKGASGAAVQNMNIMLGFEESRGLE